MTLLNIISNDLIIKTVCAWFIKPTVPVAHAYPSCIIPPRTTRGSPLNTYLPKRKENTCMAKSQKIQVGDLTEFSR